jgi:hypothetical protein
MSSAQRSKPQNDTSLVSTAFDRLLDAISRLTTDIEIGATDVPHFEAVAELLTGVPLATGDHALAMRRLENVRLYAAEHEYGAARYELSILFRSLSHRRQASI